MIKLLKEKYIEIDSKYSGLTRVLRFLIAGGTAASVNIGVVFFLTHYLNVWYVLSAVVAYIASFFVSFVSQKFWTFRDNSKHIIKKQMMIYFFVMTAGLAFNILSLYILVEYADLHYLIAQILVSATIAIGNFFIYKYFIFL